MKILFLAFYRERSGLSRWFWSDVLNGRHVNTTSVCSTHPCGKQTSPVGAEEGGGRAWSIAGCVLVTHALSKQRLLVCSCTRLFHSRLLTKDSASSCAAQTETGLFICQLYPRGYGITSLCRNMIECRPVVDV